MAVSLKNLIEVAPYDDQTRSQILAKLDSLNDDQKFRLSSACWSAISAQFQARYKARVAQAFLEIREGTKDYTKEQMQQIETDLYTEFAQLLKSAQTQEEVQQVRSEIQKFIPTPTDLETIDPPPASTPPASSASPFQGKAKN